MLDIDGNPNYAHEHAPQTTCTMIPKVVVSVDMTLAINCDDLKILPQEVEQQASICLQHVGLEYHKLGAVTMFDTNMTEYCSEAMQIVEGNCNTLPGNETIR